MLKVHDKVRLIRDFLQPNTIKVKVGDCGIVVSKSDSYATVR